MLVEFTKVEFTIIVNCEKMEARFSSIRYPNSCFPIQRCEPKSYIKNPQGRPPDFNSVKTAGVNFNYDRKTKL